MTFDLYLDTEICENLSSLWSKIGAFKCFKMWPWTSETEPTMQLWANRREKELTQREANSLWWPGSWGHFHWPGLWRSWSWSSPVVHTVKPPLVAGCPCGWRPPGASGATPRPASVSASHPPYHRRQPSGPASGWVISDNFLQQEWQNTSGMNLEFFNVGAIVSPVFLFRLT